MTSAELNILAALVSVLSCIAIGWMLRGLVDRNDDQGE